MIIQKFGGTSVGTPERMQQVADLVSGVGQKIVVLSAISGTTNALVEIAQSLYAKKNEKAVEQIGKLRAHYQGFIQKLYSSEETKSNANGLLEEHFNYLKSFTVDLFTIYEEKAVLAQGELLSTALFQFYLEEQKIPSVLLPALNFMRIDKDSEPDMFYIKQNLHKELEKYTDNQLFISQGYICRDAYGEIANLKRGGSDYTASIIGAAVDADEIQIWTDVDGMHNNDPRLIENTFPISDLSFDEAAELAYFGAKILHPASIRPAKDKNIPVRLKNTIKPDAPGTLITAESKGEGIKAVAAKDGITAIKIRSGRMLLAYGFLRSVFEVFERYKTPIDMITTSEVGVSITIDDTTHLERIVNELEEFGTVEIDADQSIICVVGDYLAEKQGIAAQVFQSLKDISVRMISFGGSKNNISLLVHSKHKKEALLAINKGLFKKS
ncbi:MAG: aspartate kinase [Flavobacteriales bacterium]|nr:MAG: aspartate kinase [Flavobacteriales bacterium]